MKRKFTKTLALVLALLVSLCALPAVSVFAAEKTTPAGLIYTENGGEVTITGYNGSADSVIIPEKIGNLTVTEIGKEAFKDGKIKYIAIPDTIRKIGVDAFRGCYTLETVDITDIGAWCEIEFVNEYSCPTILTYAKLCIDGAEITSLYIPDGTEKIGAFAFYRNLGIKAVFIPQSVKSIGQMAFRGANYIKDVYCISTGKDWEAMTEKAPAFIPESADIWLINPKETPIDGIEYIEENGKITITGYRGNLYKLSIPAEINGKPVVKIDSYAFYGKDTLAEVILPDTVKDIFPGAFCECKYLTKVNIPEGVKVIHEGVFEYCNSLNNVSFPKGLEEISGYSFRDCYGITRVEIPEGVTVVGSSAFANCYNLKEISLPDTLSDISLSTFADTAYYNNEANWDNEALYIDDYLIQVKDTAEGALTVREGTRVIASYACYECDGITEVKLPDSVVSIRDHAFYGCEKLKKINFPEGITEIPYNSFNECSSLESVALPSTVTEIGDRAFEWCHSLKEINIPDGVTKIGSRAFNCCAFESITLPEGVTSIEDGTFSYCSNLTEIKLGENVKNITNSAFDGTPLYKNKENWEDNAFYIGNCLLTYDDREATSYTVKDGTKTIGFNAFQNSYDIEELNLPESIENINRYALSGPLELKVINFGGSELQWNAIIQDQDIEELANTQINFAKESEYILGDVTLDGKLNIRDATLIQKYMAKIESLGDKALELADFNNDGKVNVKDATAIQKNIAGMPY